MRESFRASLSLLLTLLVLYTLPIPTANADETGIDQAWICVGGASSSKVHVSTATASSTVRVTNTNTQDSRLIITDAQGNFTGRLSSFASIGNVVSFQLDGQQTPSKDRTAKSCLRNGSGTILIHQFSDTDVEMTAFEAGSLDIVDWPVPGQTLERWTICDGFGDIAENCYNPTTNPGAQVTLSSHGDLGMFEYDLNNWISPTSTLSFRQALGYLADRQSITIGYAGGEAVPICSAVAPGQPGAKDCVKLGYPTSYGELSPAKALQVLNEGGFVDNNGDGVLEIVPGVNVPPIIIIIRLDDPIRTQAGLLLKNKLENLPASYRDKTTGTTVTVCPSTPVCGFSVAPQVVDRRAAASIIFTSPWKDWHIYTGGWSLGLDPDHLQPLYSSDFAPTHCGGGWEGDFPLNYPCYVDAVYDSKARPLVLGRTYADVVQAARDVQDYAWGYNSLAGKIKGTMPTVPLYSFLATKAAWKRDMGTNPLLNPDGSRTCWRGFIPQTVGTGLDNLATLTGLYLDNCQTSKTLYQSYRGEPGAILNWGFKTSIQNLNIVTSQWLWDILAMQQTYESMLGRNPVNLQEVVPVLAERFGETTYFNEALAREATVASYKLRGGVLWNDGSPLTADDIKFSIDYVRTNNGWNFPLVEHVTRVDVTDSLTLNVYFDNIGALFTQNVGFLPIIAKHVWCPSWPDTLTDCPYPTPELFPDFDFSKHVGTGPYMITGCTGINCVETITLRTNPNYLEGGNYWSLAAGISLQPDLNGDDQVNSQDLALVNEAMGSAEPLLDVDYRITGIGVRSFPNALGTGTITMTMRGVQIDSTDRYIVERLISEAADPTGLTWPPRRATYTWPDIDRDGDVDLDDLIGIYLTQFQNPQPASQSSITDVDYDADIDVDDLIIAFIRQFTRPPGTL
jgi:ABC-type transport system substrate-binding protein